MKKIVALVLLLASFCCEAQVTNTNFLWSITNTWNFVYTNIPFRLSQYPQTSGISNVIGAGVAIFPSFQPNTNAWPNAGTVDFSTNQSYGFTIDNITGDITITGFNYAGIFATNDPVVDIWYTNHDVGAHTITVPASVRTTTGARVNWVTNGQVSEYKFHLGYGMTNLFIVNYW